MSAEVDLLLDAIQRMRLVAEEVSGGRWSAGDVIDGVLRYRYGNYGWYVTGPAGTPEFEDSEQGKADALHVASWDGPPALAVADLLEKAVGGYKTEWADVACEDDCPEVCAGHGTAEFHVACEAAVDECECLAPFLTVARTFLRREAEVAR